MKDLRHPIHGHRLAPTGWRKNGAPIWPIMGGSQDAGAGGTGGTGGTGTSGDAGNGTGSSGAQGGAGTNTDGSQSGAQSGAGGDGKDGAQSGTDDPKVTQAEYDAVKARQAAADKRASDAETALQKIKDKDASELEIATRERDESVKKVEGLQSENLHLKMQIEFLQDTQVRWHDPSDALDILERNAETYGLVIEEDGTVKNMKAAIKKLADAKKHLVNTEEGTGNGAPSGSNVGGAGSGGRDKNKDDPATLKGKYPALRR